MLFNFRLYLLILSYVLLVLVTSGIGIILIISQKAFVIGSLFIIVAFYIIGALVKRLNTVNAKLKLFFDAIEDKENTLRFNENSPSREMNTLYHSLNRINDLLAEVKANSQKQERFYFSLLEEVPDGLLAWNSEGRIILANGAALRLLHTEQLVFLHQLEQLYPDLEPFFAQKESSFLLRSSNQQQLSLSLNHMKLETENITLLAIKDISNELSEKESESWSKLTRVLTHEIMNTIAPIVSLSQTLSSRKNLDEKAIRGLNIIREQSERLMEFTESYRHLSYMPEPRKELFSLTRLLHDLEILLLSDFEKAHILFTQNSAPLEITVLGDAKQLSQVFLNLIKNSIQSLEGQKDGEISITLTEAEQLTFSITDNGIGIPAEVQEKIFVPFFSTKAEGMGIGLSLCRQIIKKHGGNLYLEESRPGRTTFKIEWPIR